MLNLPNMLENVQRLIPYVFKSPTNQFAELSIYPPTKHELANS